MPNPIQREAEWLARLQPRDFEKKGGKPSPLAYLVASLVFVLPLAVAFAAVRWLLLASWDGWVRLPAWVSSARGAPLALVAVIALGEAFYQTKTRYGRIFAMIELGSAVAIALDAARRTTPNANSLTTVLAFLGAIYLVTKARETYKKWEDNNRPAEVKATPNPANVGGSGL